MQTQRGNDWFLFGMMAALVVMFSAFTYFAEARLHPVQPAQATCTTDADCGCTDDCLDAADEG